MTVPILHDDDLPADLVWADDADPGIRRRGAGRGFSYSDPNGRRVTDANTLARIRALAIPPAWTDVWICVDDLGHMQATGRDARGRKQYRYHAQFRAHREATKFAWLHEFGTALPDIRRQVATDFARRGIPREKVLATVVLLLEATLVRVGNEEYARANGSYGLTTLRDRHASCTSDGVRLVFKGKHGIAATVEMQDRRLCRVVKQCQDLPGQLLFQYVGDDGAPCPISSTDVNEYFREVSGLPVTAKDFRTWMGTLLATVALAEIPPPTSERAAKRSVTRVLEVVSDHLGNTPAVCRSSYVHPDVIASFEAGTLPARWAKASARGSRLLVPEERKLLVLLKPRRRRTATPKAA